jgi:hypothetical protein
MSKLLGKSLSFWAKWLFLVVWRGNKYRFILVPMSHEKSLVKKSEKDTASVSTQQSESLSAKPADNLELFIQPFLAKFLYSFVTFYSGGILPVIISIIILLSGITLSWYVALALLVVYAFVNCFLLWNDEHKKVRELEALLNDKSLIITVEDIFLTRPSGFEDLTSNFITVSLRVKNTLPNKNMIESCKLRIGEKEGVLRRETIVKKITKNNFPQNDRGEFTTDAVIGTNEPIVFEQGIGQTYSKTFLFVEEGNDVFNFANNLANQPYIVEVTDTYDKTYTLTGITPENLTKDELSIAL